MNQPLRYLPPDIVSSWLPYSLNGCQEFAEHVTDQPYLTTAISNTDPKAETTISRLTADLNINRKNTVVGNALLTSHGPMEKPPRFSSNTNSRHQESLIPKNAATSPNANSDTKLDRRRTQNRIAQKAFRQRKQQHAKALEVRKKELEDELKRLQQENQQLQLSMSPINQSQISNPEPSTSCFICRHILQLWNDEMIYPESITSECWREVSN